MEIGIDKQIQYFNNQIKAQGWHLTHISQGKYTAFSAWVRDGPGPVEWTGSLSIFVQPDLKNKSFILMRVDTVP